MKTAMILAAGRGERLKPLTDTKPKALCIIHNKPLIEHHVEHLAKAGFERLVINHAYLGSQIRHHLGNGARWGVEICYSAEPPGALETGGAIVNALPMLGNKPFITVNTDIFTDYSFTSLQLPETSLAHLVLVQKPIDNSQGDFGLSAANRLENINKDYTFAGIACYHPELFCKHKPGRYSITPLLRALVDEKRATAEIHTGYWFDIGTPERYTLVSSSYDWS